MRIFKKKAKRGFTLVELVVVIAVIAILAAVSVGAYFGITDSANNSKLEQEAKMVHTNLQLVLSANNSNHYMTRDGAYIGDTTIFECKFNEMTGGAVSYDFVYGSEPTSISKDTIYFIEPSVSRAPGSLTRYTHFGYYSNSIANKRAVVDIVSGKVDVEKTTVEVGGGESSEGNQSTLPTTGSNPTTGVTNKITGFRYTVNGNLIEENSIAANVGDTVTLSVDSITTTGDPINDYTVNHTSDDNIVVTSSEGVYTLTASSAGSIVFTASSNAEPAVVREFTVNFNPVIVTSITAGVAEGDKEIMIGESVEITTTIEPNNATNKTLSITADPEDAVAINDNLITGVKAADKVTITVATTDNGEESVSTSFDVKVLSEGFELTTETEINLQINETETISWNFTNTINDRQAVEVSIEQEGDIISYNEEEQQITANNNGTATITVTPTVLGNLFAKTITVNVDTKVSSIEVTSPTEVTLERGQTHQISARANQEAANPELNYVVVGESTAVTVSETGLVTAVANGDATVRITPKDGSDVERDITFTVGDITVKTFEYNIDKGTINLDETAKISISSFSPEDADNPTFSYKSNDETVLTVDANGVITPVAPGKATITVKATDKAEGAPSVVTEEITVENKKTIYFMDKTWWHGDQNISCIHMFKEEGASTTWPGVAMNLEKTFAASGVYGQTRVYSYLFDMDVYDSFVIARTDKDGKEANSQTEDIKVSSLNGNMVVLKNAYYKSNDNNGKVSTFSTTYDPLKANPDYGQFRIYFLDQAWWNADGAASTIFTDPSNVLSGWPGKFMYKTTISGKTYWYYDIDVSILTDFAICRWNPSGYSGGGTASSSGDWGAETVKITPAKIGANNLIKLSSTSKWKGDGNYASVSYSTI